MIKFMRLKINSKHLYQAVFAFLAIQSDANAQNTFPTSGNAGINTTNPAGTFQVKGGTFFDAPTSLFVTNNASDYGRTLLMLTGRYQTWNDAWIFGSGARNAIVFAQNESDGGQNIGMTGDEKFSVQLEGNSRSLGFLSKQNGNAPIMTLTQNGQIGMGSTNPRTKLDVWGGQLSVTGAGLDGTAIISSQNGIAYYGNNTLANGISINPSGNVGIGSLAKAKFDVGVYLGAGALHTVLARMSEGDEYGDGTFLGIRSYETAYGGSFSNKSFALEHSFYGIVNSSINFYRGGNRDGGYVTISTNDNTERMRVDYNGNVGIGLTNPSEKLTVNGKIKAREIRIDVQNMPDYVFEPDYQKLSLSALEEYIQKHKHLPEIPSAADSEKNGIELGEMNKILLKKVEELTLHLIEKDKELKAFKLNSTKLENRLNALEAAILKK